MKKYDLSKIITQIFSCALLVSLMSVCAFADVIWQPDDNFYTAHADKCELVNRDYYANGESGYMELFSEPGGSSLGFADNGKVFHVQFSYKQGSESWGVVSYSENEKKLAPSAEGEAKTGWIKLSDSEVKYDYQSFDEAHSSEYKTYDGNGSELKDAQNIVAWTFPNSGESVGTIPKADEDLTPKSVYTDLDGNKWGFFSYYRGMRNFWVCLSKPTDTTLAAKDVPTPEFHKATSDSVPSASGTDMTTIIIICVAAAILCTAVVFALTNKRKKDKAEKK